MSDSLPFLAAAAPLLAAVLILGLRLRDERAARLATAALALGAGFAAALLAFTITSGNGTSGNGDVVGNAILAATRSTAVLGLLTLCVGTVVVAFAGRALVGDPRSSRFFAPATALVAATVVTAFAASGVVLVIGWVATSVLLVVLVGYFSGWTRTGRSRRRVALSLGLGDVALIAAVVVAAVSIGNLDLRTPQLAASELGADGGLGAAGTAIALLIVVAGVSRSALVPLHRWLPGTLVAPTPVSALLHAGVVNGAGVLLIKTAPIAGASALAMGVLFAAGALTAVLATSVMLVRSDIKGGLAWSTAGQMGFMAVQLAVGAFAAALFHIVGHAMYKAALFLGAGSAVDAATAMRRRPHQPIPQGRLRGISMAMTVIGAASTVTAVAVLNPTGPAAATVLVAVFGSLMVARLAYGWLVGAGDTHASLRLAAAATVVTPWVYVGALAAFKNIVDAPAVVSGAVPTAPVVAVLAVVAVVAGLIGWGPTAMMPLRRGVTAALISVGTPTHRRSDVSVAADDTATARPVPVDADDSGAEESATAVVTTDNVTTGNVTTGVVTAGASTTDNNTIDTTWRSTA